MQLSVKGKQLDIGGALRAHVEASLERILGKYFGDAIDARVTFSREAHLYRAVVCTHIGRNILMEAHGEAVEPYPAFDSAAERLSKRLRRHKRWLRDHHKEGAANEENLPSAAASRAGPVEQDRNRDEAANEGNENEPPMIVAEMAEVPSLTVSEAAEWMDRSERQAMMFRNSAHGGLNMVYRRHDGNIGWLDPRGNRGS
jgi:ribosomal subunit interface protein